MTATAPTARLSQLLKPLGIRFDGGDPWIHGLELDSRKVQPGTMFCAIPGAAVDGAKFIDQAINSGARAILTEQPYPLGLDPTLAWIEVPHVRPAMAQIAREFYGRPDEQLTLMGVTGTNGKTSVTMLVQAIAEAAGKPFGRMGTIGLQFGDQTIESNFTTPEAIEFYRHLALMVEAGMEGAAIEISSHALAQSRVAGCKTDVGVFLNLTRDHLDFHQTEEAYFDAKARLFEELPEQSAAILPKGDEYGEKIAQRTKARVFWFGTDDDADIRLEQGKVSISGTSGQLSYGDQKVEIESRIVGPFQLQNIAAASAAALVMGWPLEAIQQGLASVQGIPGRMEPIDQGQPFGVLVDYAHTEEALKQSILASRGLTESKVILVFGCGGDRDRGKRPKMGQVAATYADLIFLTHDNPRTEDPEKILDDIEVGIQSVGRESADIVRVHQRAEAIERAIKAAEPGDIVLIAGKGHEQVQIFADGPVAFDDRAVARSVLTSQGYEGASHALT